MLCGSLGASLSWIILLAEDAPDLLQSSPVRAGIVRTAKLTASVLPVFGLVAVPLAWLVWRAPLPGLLATTTVAGAALSAALVNLWTGRPAARGEFRNRGQRSVATRLLELSGVLSWSALAWLLQRAAGGEVGLAGAAGLGAAAAIAVGIVPLAWLLRHRVR
jgi:ABC-2 type transport system permease protein